MQYNTRKQQPVHQAGRASSPVPAGPLQRPGGPGRGPAPGPGRKPQDQHAAVPVGHRSCRPESRPQPDPGTMMPGLASSAGPRARRPWTRKFQIRTVSTAENSHSATPGGGRAAAGSKWQPITQREARAQSPDADYELRCRLQVRRGGRSRTAGSALWHQQGVACRAVPGPVSGGYAPYLITLWRACTTTSCGPSSRRSTIASSSSTRRGRGRRCASHSADRLASGGRSSARPGSF